MEFLFVIIIIYLYGSIPFSLLLGFTQSVDIRNEGSGNVGGTNLGRVCGKKFFLLGFALDASKGVICVLLGNAFGISPILLYPFALLGHSFSIFIKFKGGKGVSTSFGFIVAFTPMLAIASIIAFLLIAYISKYISLASIIATFIYFLLSIVSMPNWYSFLALLVFMFFVYSHRENIKRIKSGTENKITI